MKKIVRFVLVMVVPLVLSSCWSTQVVSLQEEYNQQWKNATKKEIIHQFGIPNSIVDIEDGESIMIYEDFEYNASLEGRARGNVDLNSKAYKDRIYTEYFLDKDNVCFHVRTNKTKNIRQSEPTKTALLIGVITLSLTPYIVLLFQKH